MRAPFSSHPSFVYSQPLHHSVDRPEVVGYANQLEPAETWGGVMEPIKLSLSLVSISNSRGPTERMLTNYEVGKCSPG